MLIMIFRKRYKHINPLCTRNAMMATISIQTPSLTTKITRETFLQDFLVILNTELQEHLEEMLVIESTNIFCMCLSCPERVNTQMNG